MEGMEGMAMGGMSAAGWSFAAALVFVGVWTVMMAAMMLPAAAPMILTFASAQARHDHAAAVPTVDLRRRLSVRLVGGRRRRLCTCPIWRRSVELPCLSGSRRLGTACARGDPGRGRALSIHAAQARLPASLPFAVGVRGAALARRSARGDSHGDLARRVLSLAAAGRCSPFWLLRE